MGIQFRRLRRSPYVEVFSLDHKCELVRNAILRFAIKY